MKPEWWMKIPPCKNISLILAAHGWLLSSRPIIMTQSMGAKAKDRWTPLAVDCAQLPKYCRKRPGPKHDLHRSPCLMTPCLLLYDIIWYSWAWASGMDGGCTDTLIIFVYFVPLWFFQFNVCDSKATRILRCFFAPEGQRKNCDCAA